MKKCNECLYYGVTEADPNEMSCSKPTSEMTDIVCLLRRILWAVYCVQESVDRQTFEGIDDDDDESWKVPK